VNIVIIDEKRCKTATATNKAKAMAGKHSSWLLM